MIAFRSTLYEKDVTNSSQQEFTPDMCKSLTVFNKIDGYLPPVQEKYDH